MPSPSLFCCKVSKRSKYHHGHADMRDVSITFAGIFFQSHFQCLLQPLASIPSVSVHTAEFVFHKSFFGSQQSTTSQISMIACPDPRLGTASLARGPFEPSDRRSRQSPLPLQRELRILLSIQCQSDSTLQNLGYLKGPLLTTMNRLFGAKSTAPKPTLSSAISNVRRSACFTSTATP